MKNIFQKVKVAGKYLNMRDVSILASILTLAPRSVSAGPVLNELVQITCNIRNYIFTFALIIGTMAALWAGYLYMTAGGDETKVSSANKTLLYAAIGIAVVLIAGGIPNLVGSVLHQSVGNACP